ncbi:MAG: glycosyltransferase family 2 protein [Solirubrobacterales bacterium]
MAESTSQNVPGLSIIVCTRNRADLLRLCLEALARQQGVPPEAYEILVVDNGSTDATREVVEAVRRGCPQIRYLHETRPGLSIARNTGVDHATGGILCFLDDDAVASPNFIGEVLSSFENPEVASLAGKIVASWPDGGPPGWFSPRYANVVAQTSFGEAARWMKKNEFPFGANMSFRREVFRELGGFDENLGKRGENNIWGEEIDLCHRMQEKGLRFFYNPQSCVHHIVGPGRATKRYFVESIFGKGVTEGYQKLAHRGKAVFTAYLFLKAGRLAAASAYYLSAGSVLSEASRFRLRCEISWYAGYLHFLAVREDFGSVSPADGGAT